MKVEVLYFAGARDRAGVTAETIQFPRGATAADFLDRVVSLHPGLLKMKSSLRIAVNHEIVPSDHVVAEGDEIGILPPVAGG